MNETNSQNKSCFRSVKLDKTAWYQFMLIPAVLCVIFLAFLRPRRRLCRDTLYGRPGLPSVTIWMLHEIIIGDLIFGFPNSIIGEYWVRIISSILIGVICYPIFGGVTSENVYGYAIGTLYVWTLTVCIFLMNYPCENLFSEGPSFMIRGILKFLKFLPCALWLLYLCVIYPYRFYAKIRGYSPTLSIRSFRIKESIEPEEPPYLIYVRHMMQRHLEECEPQTSTVTMTLANRMHNLIGRIYEPVPGFRYSVSILAAVFVSILLLYLVTLSTIDVFVQSENEANINVPMGLFSFKALIYVTLRLMHGGNAKLITYGSIATAFLLTVISLLCMLKRHRRNLLDLYRGNGLELPSYEQSARGIIVDSMRFVGCQFAFSVWAFFCQIVVLTILCNIAVVLIVLLLQDIYSPESQFILGIGTLIFYAIVMIAVQHLIVHLFFQQRDSKGKRTLAIDNRSLFVNVQYFMIFPNATIGLVSCLMRVGRTLLFCMWNLPRLDRSTLSRRYEDCDRGFTSYIGLLRVEHAQTNPTVLSFVYFLLSSVRSASGNNRFVSSALMISDNNGNVTNPQPRSPSAATRRFAERHARKLRIRNRYLLWITLENNPGIRIYRDWRIKLAATNPLCTPPKSPSEEDEGITKRLKLPRKKVI